MNLYKAEIEIKVDTGETLITCYRKEAHNLYEAFFEISRIFQDQMGANLKIASYEVTRFEIGRA